MPVVEALSNFSLFFESFNELIAFVDGRFDVLDQILFRLTPTRTNLNPAPSIPMHGKPSSLSRYSRRGTHRRRRYERRR
jgi:hypothetical protein